MEEGRKEGRKDTSRTARCKIVPAKEGRKEGRTKGYQRRMCKNDIKEEYQGRTSRKEGRKDEMKEARKQG